jgi:hypothetical protein
MPMFNFLQPTGADAGIYASYALDCVNGGNCWREIRPAGFIQYVAIPIRMGWPMEALIGMNLALMLLSALLATVALGALLPQVPAAKRWGLGFPLSLASHALFMLGCAHYILADVPAAACALSAVWLLLLAVLKDKAWLYPLAGLALGLAVCLRAFYLYPALLALAISALLVWPLRRTSPSAWTGLALLVLGPILMQTALTHRHTGVWSFLEPKNSAYYQASEMGTTAYAGGNISGQPVYGADPVADRMLWYDCTGCFNGPPGWDKALLRGDLLGMAHLALRRAHFYLGSWSYQPVLPEESDRHWSIFILLANLLAFGLAIRLCWRGGLAVAAGPLAILAASSALAVVIHPEYRFLMGPLTGAWVLGPGAWALRWYAEA